MIAVSPCIIFFFFNDTATTEIYTLSLHDALPIYRFARMRECIRADRAFWDRAARFHTARPADCSAERPRSEEHTSELQSPDHLVCRLLLEKKNNLTPPSYCSDVHTDDCELTTII